MGSLLFSSAWVGAGCVVLPGAETADSHLYRREFPMAVTTASRMTGTERSMSHPSYARITARRSDHTDHTSPASPSTRATGSIHMFQSPMANT